MPRLCPLPAKSSQLWQCRRSAEPAVACAVAVSVCRPVSAVLPTAALTPVAFARQKQPAVAAPEGRPSQPLPVPAPSPSASEGRHRPCCPPLPSRPWPLSVAHQGSQLW
jgi:hypothetical protein